MESWKRKLRMGMVGGGQSAVKWAQENPNYLELYRYGEPRQTLTRGQRYLSDANVNSCRLSVIGYRLKSGL